ncbi:MAG: 50S ribosomal protein L15 [Hyphomicrobiaceae bacterium]
MRLNQITDNAGSRKSRKRLGRGIGSGLGKTGGRGGKGQTARTGVAINGFEGGQMPIYRRLPKRGFNVPFPQDFNEINVGDIQAAVDAGRIAASEPITVESLVESGILRRPKDGLRLLGDGELTAKLSFVVKHATKSARAAVEKAGGSIQLIERRVDEDAEKKRAKSAAKGKGRGRSKKAASGDE